MSALFASFSLISRVAGRRQRKLQHSFSPTKKLTSRAFSSAPRFLTTNTRAWPYIYRAESSAKMAPQLDSYFKSVDDLSDAFVTRLSDAVAIPSISAEDERRPDVIKMGHYLEKQLEDLGAYMEARELGPQPHKEYLTLPPAIIGRYPAKKDETKRTVLV